MAEEVLDIVVAGQLAIDILHEQGKRFERLGGCGYSAVAAASFGSSVGLISSIGEDMPDGLLSLLAEAGVDLAGVETVKEATLRHDMWNVDELLPRFTRASFATHWPLRIPPKYLDCKAVLLNPLHWDSCLAMAKEYKRHGTLVAFDPQSDYTSLFQISQLLEATDILLLNCQELLLLTGAPSIDRAIRNLLLFPIEIVIVKLGRGGAYLFKEGGAIKIPSFAAESVCTVGTGDVFNGVFLAELTRSTPVVEAAKVASCAAACFTEAFDLGAMPKPGQVREALVNRATRFLDPSEVSNVKLYLAGPFFDRPSLDWVQRITAIIEAQGFTVFSPSRNAGVLNSSSTDSERSDYFRRDVGQLEGSDGVIALLDGADAGTAWEIGYAFSLGKPIFGLLTESDGAVNNMIVQSCKEIARSERELVDCLLGNWGETGL